MLRRKNDQVNKGELTRVATCITGTTHNPATCAHRVGIACHPPSAKTLHLPSTVQFRLGPEPTTFSLQIVILNRNFVSLHGTANAVCEFLLLPPPKLVAVPHHFTSLDTIHPWVVCHPLPPSTSNSSPSLADGHRGSSLYKFAKKTHDVTSRKFIFALRTTVSH